MRLDATAPPAALWQHHRRLSGCRRTSRTTKARGNLEDYGLLFLLDLPHTNGCNPGELLSVTSRRCQAGTAALSHTLCGLPRVRLSLVTFGHASSLPPHLSPACKPIWHGMRGRGGQHPPAPAVDRS
jgi:hypothetical protein